MKQSIVEKLFNHIQKQKEMLALVIKTPDENHAMINFSVWPDRAKDAKPGQHKFGSLVMGSDANIEELLYSAMDDDPRLAAAMQNALTRVILQKWEETEEENKKDDCNCPACEIRRQIFGSEDGKE